MSMAKVPQSPQVPPKRPRYHHGALQKALLRAGEQILTERGVDGFSLREAARRAGVSPAAPSYHFGDARGLLTAIAAQGFQKLTGALQEADRRAVGDHRARVRAQCRAYVAFALRNPALFELMWRRTVLNDKQEDYLLAGRQALNAFETVVLDADISPATAPRRPPARVIAAWSMVHGYARLALDGALGPWKADLLEDVLDHLPVAATQ